MIQVLLIAAALGSSLLTSGRGVGVAAQAASSPPTPQFHAVPCPHVLPNSLHIDWTLQRASAPRSSARGSRLLTSVQVVRHVYHEICSSTLVKYDRPLVTTCPLAQASETYHLIFLRGRRVLLGAREQHMGCSSISIDGHHDLGAIVGSLVLPPGIPR